MPATRTNKRRALSLQELDGWFLILHIVLEHVYHIIHAQVYYDFCISFLCSWIDMLNLNQPFNWRVEPWEPFKMKLIWGLQSWTLGSPIESNPNLHEPVIKSPKVIVLCFTTPPNFPCPYFDAVAPLDKQPQLAKRGFPKHTTWGVHN